jgi:hypothetical protein
MPDEQWAQLNTIGEQILRNAEVMEGELAERMEQVTTADVANPDKPLAAAAAEDAGIARGVSVCQNPHNQPASNADLLQAVRRTMEAGGEEQQHMFVALRLKELVSRSHKFKSALCCTSAFLMPQI